MKLKICESRRFVSLICGDSRYTLAKSEINILIALYMQNGAISRRDLLRAGWPGKKVYSRSYTNSLNVAIANLRRLFTNLGYKGESITTVRGFGYDLQKDIELILIESDMKIKRELYKKILISREEFDLQDEIESFNALDFEDVMKSIQALDYEDEIENLDIQEVIQRIDALDRLDVIEVYNPAYIRGKVDTHDAFENQDEIEIHDDLDIKEEIESHDVLNIQNEIASHDDLDIQVEIESHADPDLQEEIESYDALDIQEEIESHADPDIQDEIASHDVLDNQDLRDSHQVASHHNVSENHGVIDLNTKLSPFFKCVKNQQILHILVPFLVTLITYFLCTRYIH
ncbi:MAG: transcriptional regulator [Vibrio sp.]